MTWSGALLIHILGEEETMLTNCGDFVLHSHMHRVDLLRARGPDCNVMIIATPPDG